MGSIDSRELVHPTIAYPCSSTCLWRNPQRKMGQEWSYCPWPLDPAYFWLDSYLHFKIKYCGSNMDRDHLWVHWERCLCPDRVMHHVFGVKVPWKGGCGYWKSGEKEGKEVKVLETLKPVKGAQAGSVSSSSELSILPILTRNQSQPQPPTHLGKHHSCHLTPRSAIL